MFNMREYREEDFDNLMDVCLKTGDGGKDGSEKYKEFPLLLGEIYFAPYAIFHKELVVVLEDEEHDAVGYCVAAADSVNFYKKAWDEYLSTLLDQYPKKIFENKSKTVQELGNSFYNYLKHDDAVLEKLKNYKAHLHIDLLKKAQGKGWGKLMIKKQFELLKNQGVQACHLEHGISNTKTHSFYQKIGMHEIFRTEDSIYMGITF